MKPSEYVRKGWCKDAFAVDENGNDVPSSDPRAVRWCLLGAMIASDLDPDLSACLEDEIRGEVSWPATWNDTPGRTQQEVIDLLERCEAACGIV